MGINGILISHRKYYLLSSSRLSGLYSTGNLFENYCQIYCLVMATEFHGIENNRSWNLWLVSVDHVISADCSSKMPGFCSYHAKMMLCRLMQTKRWRCYAASPISRYYTYRVLGLCRVGTANLDISHKMEAHISQITN